SATSLTGRSSSSSIARVRWWARRRWATSDGGGCSALKRQPVRGGGRKGASLTQKGLAIRERTPFLREAPSMGALALVRPTQLALAFGFAAALLAAGCVPNVCWLPDSSGFVFTGGKEFRQLLLYDVKAKKVRILVDDTGAKTLWPA